MPHVEYRGKLAGSFHGFNSDQLFQLANGSFWIQSRYRYWYHYAYRPDVEILEHNGQFTLTVAGESIPVRRLRDVIVSSINGAFEGWSGQSQYELANGQVWQQAVYKYEYVYKYNPAIVIYNAGSGHIMDVDGSSAAVRRLK